MVLGGHLLDKFYGAIFILVLEASLYTSIMVCFILVLGGYFLYWC